MERLAAERVIFAPMPSRLLKTAVIPVDNPDMGGAMARRLGTGAEWTESQVGACPERSFALDHAQGPELEASSDLVELHESIGKLLATQGDWQRAYSHLSTALKLAREHDCATRRIPDQYRREVSELRRAHAEALEASMRDALTASYNRRYLDQQLVNLLADQRESGVDVAIALIDLDYFKRVNDTYGHQIGDQVLQRVVALLQDDLPAGAFCARYGGEEFALVLPELDAHGGVVALERARNRVAEHPWHRLAPNLRITISAGLTHTSSPERARALRPARINAERQLRRADDLLYAAKRAGRNAVAYRRDGAIRIAGLDDQVHHGSAPRRDRPSAHPLGFESLPSVDIP